MFEKIDVNNIYQLIRYNGNEATVKKVIIKQGQNYNGMVEVLEGLKEGDMVISTGFQDVNAGETVLYL